jgi:hypothetical protein
MSYLNNLPADVSRIVWQLVYAECLPHIKDKAYDYYKGFCDDFCKKSKERRSQYKSYVNSRGNIVIEPVHKPPTPQDYEKLEEYYSFAYEIYEEINGEDM